MYELMRLPMAQAEKIVQEQQNQTKKMERIAIPGNVVTSVFIIAALSFRNPKNAWIFMLIFGVGTGLIGTVLLLRMCSKKKKNLRLVEAGQAQYAVLKELPLDEPVEFKTVEGGKLEKTFAKDAYSKYQGEVIFVWIPETGGCYLYESNVIAK
ncbi:hypothetical protein [Faecalicatena contorta]|uniref:hypothetical protein n=1 Tax=Faecalicatena contorta TaxID=39482 RepID=UPI001F1B83A6|nr:hypothetical protein [Faecalicatena contorta]MCF2682025.1 hypothetical protein [Faecalicatena contorta]